MIDVNSEHLLTLAEAAALIPGRPSLCAIWRWRKRGVRGGRKLETVVIGGRPYTSREAIQRFAYQQGGSNTPAPRSPRRREREISRAEAELAKAGI